MDTTATGADIVSAGFWRRLGAYVIDSLILTIGFYVVTAVLLLGVGLGTGLDMVTSDASEPGWLMLTSIGWALLYYPVAALYYALQESSRHQATVGKRTLGIKVVDEAGGRLSRGRAFGRWFAATLSYLTLYIGFLLAAFTRRKQALHDMVASTLVVDRWAYTDHPERQQRHVGGLAVVLSLLLLVIPVLAVLAAIAIPAYHDYVARAAVMEVVAPMRALGPDLDRAQAAMGRCAVNGDPGVGPPDAFATRHTGGVVVGSFDDGSCGMEAEFRTDAPAGLAGHRVWLTREADGRWTCSSDLADARLPAECRG